MFSFQVIFNSEQTYELMYCLEEVRMGRNVKVTDVKDRDEDAMAVDEGSSLSQVSIGLLE